MAPRNKIIDFTGRSPATEDSSARDGDYIYLSECQMSDDIRQEITARVKEEVGLRPHRRCKCKLKNDERCTTRGCSNRKHSYACVDCPPGCTNNPWENKTFAIQNQKIFTHYEKEKGWGLYALKPIKKNEWVGEYKGILTKEIPNDERLNYLMVLKNGLDIYIDPFKHGSAMKMINHGLFKCVVVATRNIKPGEELTINYGWVYNSKIQERPTCHCGHKACLKYLGDLEESGVQRLVVPTPFHNVTLMASEAKLKQLNSIPVLNYLDLNRREDHLFGAEEPVAVITKSNKQLRVSMGKVIECFVTEHKLYFYVVRVVEQRIIDYTVPMWFVFRNIEVAEAMLDKVFTMEEKVKIGDYFNKLGELCNPTSAKKIANSYEGEIIFTYVKRFLDEKIPRFEKRERQVVGSTSLGFNSVYLEIVVEPDTQKDPPVHCPMKPTTQYNLTGREAMMLEKKLIMLRKQEQVLPANLMDQSSEYVDPLHFLQIELEEETPDKTFSTQADEGPQALQSNTVYELLKEFQERSGDDNLQSMYDEYGHMNESQDEYAATVHVRDINEVVENCRNVALYKRFFQHAVEQLSIITLWRCPLDVALTFEEVYRQLEQELYTHYYAQRPRDRRFLLMEHYRVMCEIIKPGSYNLRYCSLCEMTHNYESLEFWNAHFRECHEIGAALYRCKCDDEYETRFVSEFRRHVSTCCPELSGKLTTNLPDYFVDSFAYYLALRGENRKMRHLLVPGQALVVEEKATNQMEGKPMKTCPVIYFSPDTLMPLDSNIIMKPHNFRIQQQNSELRKGWKFHQTYKAKSVFELSKVENRNRGLPLGHSESHHDNKSEEGELKRTDTKVLYRKRRKRSKKGPRDAKSSNTAQNAGPSWFSDQHVPEVTPSSKQSTLSSNVQSDIYSISDEIASTSKINASTIDHVNKLGKQVLSTKERKDLYAKSHLINPETPPDSGSNNQTQKLKRKFLSTGKVLIQPNKKSKSAS